MRSSIAVFSKRIISTFFAATLALGLAPATSFAANDSPSEEADASLPVGDIINQEVALDTVVAQTEATTSYFLAQTLESTHTVPMVSASLPLNNNLESEDIEEDELLPSFSTVVGSFIYRGITYAVEPGGESVAVVAADYAKLPEEFIEAQTIVLPSMVSADDIDFYSVTRIADHAFANCAMPSQANNNDDPTRVISTEASDSERSGEIPTTDGITAITIPASITTIGDDAFTDFDTLQYLVVSEDNPNYSMYDGCLYDKPLTSLLLIPEGRLGAVRVAPSVTSVDSELFSHCSSVDTLIADANSAAYQLLQGIDFSNKPILSEAEYKESDENNAKEAITYSGYQEVISDEPIDLCSLLGVEPAYGSIVYPLGSQNETQQETSLVFLGSGISQAEVGVVTISSEGQRTFAFTSLVSAPLSEETLDIDTRASAYAGTVNASGNVYLLIESHGLLNDSGWDSILKGNMHGKVTYTSSTPASSDGTVTVTKMASDAVFKADAKNSAFQDGSQIIKGLTFVTNAGTTSSVTTKQLRSGTFSFSAKFWPTSTTSYFLVPQANVTASFTKAVTHSFDYCDGVTEIKKVCSPSGLELVIPGQEVAWRTNNPTRVGYDFVGWYRDADQSNNSRPVSFGSTSPTSATTYYAHWTPHTTLVTLDPNDGSSSAAEAALPKVTATYDSPMPVNGSTAWSTEWTKPADRAGYELVGYSAKKSDGSLGEQYYSYDSVTGHLVSTQTWDQDVKDATLYATWRYKTVIDPNAFDPSGNIAATIVSGADGWAVEKITIHGRERDVYTYTAIDGKAFSLPNSVSRSGYVPVTVWTSAAEEDAGKTFAGTVSATAHPNFTQNELAQLGYDERAFVLYADWSGHANVYKVSLDHKGGIAMDDSLFERKGASSINAVSFDSPVLTDGVRLDAPYCMGSEFIGYYTEPQGRTDDEGNPIRGIRYLAPDDTGEFMIATSETFSHTDAANGSTITLYAHYSDNSFAVRFTKVGPAGESNAVGPDGALPVIEGVHYGDTFNSMAYDVAKLTLSCDGYEFLGWSADAAADPYAANIASKLVFNGKTGQGYGSFLQESDLTLFPIWKAKEYTISWNLAHPNGLPSDTWTTTQRYGQPLRFPNASGDATAPADTPTLTGYSFVGWYTAAEGGTKLAEGAFRPTGDNLSNTAPTYFAHWSARSYTVRLMPGSHGRYDADVYGTNTVTGGVDPAGDYVFGYTVSTRGKTFEVPAVTTMGYHFNGWLKLKDGCEADPNNPDVWEPTSHTAVSKDEPGFPDIYAGAVYLATWSASTATVNLDLGGVDGQPAPSTALDPAYSTTGNTYSVEESYALPPASALSWKGHTFLGWYITAPADLAQDPAAANPNAVASVAPGNNPVALTYTAAWASDVYTVRFVQNDFAPYDEVDVADPQTLTRDDDLIVPAPAFRNAFPADKRTEANPHYAVVFSRYVLECNGETYDFRVGDDPVNLGELIDTLSVKDVNGDAPHNRSTIKFYAKWNASYHIDVTPEVHIAFDPDRVKESSDALIEGTGKLVASNPAQAASFRVVSLVCDPIAHESEAQPGTSDAFRVKGGTSAAAGTYLTVAGYRQSDGTSASVASPLEVNMDALAASTGKTLSGWQAPGTSEIATLPELGFVFGNGTAGASEAARTLQLKFGLRFDDTVNPRDFTLLNQHDGFKDSGSAVKLARMYYTIALDE